MYETTTHSTYLPFSALNFSTKKESMQIVSVCMLFLSRYLFAGQEDPPPQNSAQAKNLGKNPADN